MTELRVPDGDHDITEAVIAAAESGGIIRLGEGTYTIRDTPEARERVGPLLDFFASILKPPMEGK